MKFKKLIVLSLASFSIMTVSQSAFAIKVTIDKNGHITFDKSDDKSDKTVVLNQKKCNLTIIDKGSTLMITDKNKVTDTVTNKEKKTDSLVYINNSKTPRIVKNGHVVKKETKEYMKLKKKYK